ncbi:MAG: PAS domain-containing sensor histidine kinase [Anaerolineae bacterium]|nr:PAS domain-containing sensor histidine kinase [Anaerolineae bacterium]
MQQPKDKRPSSHRISLNLAVGLLLILLASLLLAGLIIGQVRSGQSDFSLMVLLLGVLALGAVLTVMLVFDVRRQAGASGQNETELRRQNADLVRANNDLQSQLSGRASELADERTQSKAILQSMSEAVVVLDSERVRYSNRALTRLTGFSGDDLTSKSLSAPDAVSLAGQLAHLREIVSAAIAQGGIWQGPFKLNMKDGKELDVAVIGLPLDAGATPSGQMLLLIRDNSQEKRLQSQRNTFVTNASHELRTPLSNIKTRLYLLRKQPEKMDEHLAVMDEMAAHMQQLLEEMLDIGRFERGAVMLDRDSVVLQELVSEAVTGYQPRAARRSVTLESDVTGPPIKVLVDQKRMVQVITNLISNAVNHSPQEGHVDVHVMLDPNSNGRKMACVQVQDNGMALSPEMLAHVFQPFTNASMGLVSGTVLGLSLTKEIVELHGGDIKVESDAQKGTLYTVRLPALEN